MYMTVVSTNWRLISPLKSHISLSLTRNCTVLKEKETAETIWNDWSTPPSSISLSRSHHCWLTASLLLLIFFSDLPQHGPPSLSLWYSIHGICFSQLRSSRVPVSELRIRWGWVPIRIDFWCRLRRRYKYRLLHRSEVQDAVSSKAPDLEAIWRNHHSSGSQPYVLSWLSGSAIQHEGQLGCAQWWIFKF